MPVDFRIASPPGDCPPGVFSAPARLLGPREWFVISLLLVGIWFWLHPYFGVAHDALLYVGQALSYLHPHLAENDVFFRFGQQGGYNLFDDVLAVAIAVLGLDSAVIFLLLAGQALWLAATFLLARRLAVDSRLLLLFLAFVVSLSPFYSSHGVFAYGEGSFLSPRIYAEALVLLAIGSSLAGRRLLAMLLIAACLLAHPLVALSGAAFLAVFWMLEGLSRGELFVATFVACLGLVAGGLGVPPLDGLWRTMDADWLAVSVQRSPWILLGEWDEEAFGIVLFDLSLLAVAIRYQVGALRRVLSSALWAGVAGVVATIVFGDLLHNQFLIQLQPWRTLWLTHWFTYLAAALLICGGLYKTVAGRGLLLAFLTAFLAPAPMNGAIALLVAVLCFGGVFERLATYPPWLRRLLLLVPILVATGWLGLRVFWAELMWSAKADTAVLSYAHWLMKGFRTLLPLLCLLAWVALQRGRSGERWLAVFLAATMFVTGVAGWDQRSAWQKQVESGKADARALFGVDIPLDAQVYWRDELAAVWLGLQRASYVSFGQGAATLFSRDLSLVYQARMDDLALLGDPGLAWEGRWESRNKARVVTQDEARQVCGHGRQLDYLVLAETFPGLSLGHFSHPDGGRFHLYRCATLSGVE